MRSKKPKIGITLSETVAVPEYRWPAKKPFDWLKHEYYQAIVDAGGIPILMPNVESREIEKEYIDSIDGLLLTGGADIDPRTFGQDPHPKLSTTTAARDNFELKAIKLTLDDDKPILGICRGHQVLNVAFGGTLFQDLVVVGHETGTHADPDQTSRVFHNVRIEEQSKLFEILGNATIEINSSHHQVVDKLGNGLKATAFSIPDNLVEAIEHPDRDFIIGVQWHPEGILQREHSRKIFEAFIRAAQNRIK